MIASDESQSGLYGPTTLEHRSRVAEDMLFLGMKNITSVRIRHALLEFIEFRFDGTVIVTAGLGVREQADDDGLGLRHEEPDIVAQISIALQVRHLTRKTGIDPLIHEACIAVQTSRRRTAGIIETDFQSEATYGIRIKHQAKTRTRLLNTS